MKPDVNCARWDSTLLVMELVSPVLRVAPSAKALQYAVFAIMVLLYVKAKLEDYV